VRRELDAVVGDPPLAVVVRADLLGAVAGADLRAPVAAAAACCSATARS
jgi:hypothetical protein